MAVNSNTSPIPQGSQVEQELFTELKHHYSLSTNDLRQRITGFDKQDELFRSHINKTDWPYKTLGFVPKTFEFIIEKSSRLIANKLRGKVYPREGGDVVKAKIANQVLNYQWDSANNDGTMLQKWGLMDQLTRKYGASFAIVHWRNERRTVRGKEGLTKKEIFNGPEMRVLSNRDVLVNPSYSTIKKWFQYREWLTVGDLEAINNSGTKEPKYKNLDLLRSAIDPNNTGLSDSRSTAYVTKNKSIKGLEDTLGQDAYNKVIEVVTELRQDRWITFTPRHGIILRDTPNPLDSMEIPVVMLKYYAIDDDIYGLSEIEPIEKLQRIVNALASQYLDTVNTDLYPPLMINPRNVQMHTIEFGPNKKWLMNTPDVDVKRFQTSTAATNQFASTYGFLLSAIQSAVGETSEGTSSITPFNPNKTATEVRDSAVQRLSRDNYNQIFLAEALKRQMMLFLELNKQFITKSFILRVVDRETIKQLESAYTADGQAIVEGHTDQVDETGQAIVGQVPVTPVQFGGQTMPKFQTDPLGETGELIVQKDDLMGELDYVPDVTSMSLNYQDIDRQNKQNLVTLLTTNPLVLQLLQSEGYIPKAKEILVELLEDSGLKDADRFFGQAPQPQMPGQIDPATGQPIQPTTDPTAPQGVPNAGPDMQSSMPPGAGVQVG